MGFTNRVRLQQKLKAIPIKVRRALKAQNAANAAEMVETVKRFIRVDEGVLKASVKHQDVSDSTRLSQRVSVGGTATTKKIGTRTYDSDVRLGGHTSGRTKKAGGEGVTYDYALAQEYGTVEMPANPALWPAWRLKRRRFKARMSRAAKKAIQGAAT